MIRIFVITELSIFRLLLLAALGREILILHIDPFLPHTKGVLQRIVEAVVHNGRATWAIDTMDEFRRIKDVPGKSVLYDVFGEIEPWQNDYFDFANAEETTGDYAMAFKLAVTNYLTEKHVSLLVLRRLFGEPAEQKYQCIGMPADTRAAAENFCGKALPCSTAWIPLRLVNPSLAIVVLLASLWWIVRRVRFGQLQPKSFFFAADFIGDDRDVRLYRELEDGGPMLMVPRGTGRNSPLAAELGGYTFQDLDGGFLKIGDLIPTVKMIIADEWRFYRHFNAVYPALFWRLAKLPYLRLLYRGLFTRFRPKYFWGRDPYNEDHIIRRQELNRVGGKSYGVNTGNLTWAIHIPPWRYISFDRFYVFGCGKYKKYFGDTWAKDMEIVPAGSFSAARDHYVRRFDPRPPDIAVFASVFVGEPELEHLVRGLASAFPDRKIILQVKTNFDGVPGTQEFIDRCRKGLPNVEYSSDSVYDIFFQARYGFSDPSSVVVEAMQFGMISFAFDLPHIQATNVDREYPGLTVKPPEEAIARIRAIEQGTWRYPIEDFQDVVDLSGMVFFDRVRRDMGLAVKEESVPLLENQEGWG